jgi:antitoxin YefM
MRVVNYSEFRNHLAENLNAVNDDKELVLVSRGRGKSIVVMDLDEYNSIQETLHLLRTKTNLERLEESIQEMVKGKCAKHKLMEK